LARKDRAIIVRIGSKLEESIHEITKECQKAYADRINCDYITIDSRYYNRIYLDNPRIVKEMSYYTQTLNIRPNVIPTGLVDNIFDMVDIDQWGLINMMDLSERSDWVSYQKRLDVILESKNITKKRVSDVASVEFFIAPHHVHEILNEEDYTSVYDMKYECVWFTYNLNRKKQRIKWLDQTTCSFDIDPEFNRKYPYSKFINRNIDDPDIEKKIKSDLRQHCGRYDIPEYINGKNAIVVVDFQDRFYSNTRNSILNYANRIGCQLIEIKGEYSKNMHACWPKYLAAKVAKDFDKTLYLDTDVYISKTAPNIFERVPDNCWCMVDESSINRAKYEIMDSEYNMLMDRMESKHHCRWHINNAGILIIPRNGHEIYKIEEPWILDNFADEQTLFNYTMYGRELHILDTSWNTMPFTKSREPVKFFHIASSNKLFELCKYLNKEYVKVLIKFTNKHKSIAKSLMEQLIEVAHVGMYNIENTDFTENAILKYYEVVVDVQKFQPNLVINIDTEITQDYNNIVINSDSVYCEFDSISIYDFIDASIYAPIYEEVPRKCGNSLNYLDIDMPVIGINFHQDIDYSVICDLLEDRSFVTISIGDRDKSLGCDYRFNDMENIGDLLSKLDVLIDIERKFDNHHVVTKSVNCGVPVLSGYKSNYTIQCHDYVDVMSRPIFSDKKLTYNNYQDNLNLWKKIIVKYMNL
jgi:hypothetical protein